MNKEINANDLINRKEVLGKDTHKFLTDSVSRINKELEEIKKISAIYCESEDTYQCLGNIFVNERNNIFFSLYEE